MSPPDTFGETTAFIPESPGRGRAFTEKKFPDETLAMWESDDLPADATVVQVTLYPYRGERVVLPWHDGEPTLPEGEAITGESGEAAARRVAMERCGISELELTHLGHFRCRSTVHSKQLPPGPSPTAPSSAPRSAPSPALLPRPATPPCQVSRSAPSEKELLATRGLVRGNGLKDAESDGCVVSRCNFEGDGVAEVGAVDLHRITARSADPDIGREVTPLVKAMLGANECISGGEAQLARRVGESIAESDIGLGVQSAAANDGRTLVGGARQE
jgi:hypothetical protein